MTASHHAAQAWIRRSPLRILLLIALLVGGIASARNITQASSSKQVHTSNIKAAALTPSVPQVSDLTDVSFTVILTTSTEQNASLNWGTAANALNNNVADQAADPSTIHRFTVTGLPKNPAATQYFYEPVVNGTPITNGGQPFMVSTPADLGPPPTGLPVAGTVQTASAAVPAANTVLLVGFWTNPDNSKSQQVSVLNATPIGASVINYTFLPTLVNAAGNAFFTPVAGATFTVDGSGDVQAQLVAAQAPVSATLASPITREPLMTLQAPGGAATSTPTVTATATNTATVTQTPAVTFTRTATPTVTNTATATGTATQTPLVTFTQTATATLTLTPNKPTVTPTITSTPTKTATPSALVDLKITKTHTGIFPPGGTGKYTITVQNIGGKAATGPTTVFDSLPLGLTFKSVQGAGWFCLPGSGRTINCTYTGTIGAGASVPFSLTVNVAEELGSTSVVNTATVVNVLDSNLNNNVARDPTNIH